MSGLVVGIMVNFFYNREQILILMENLGLQDSFPVLRYYISETQISKPSRQLHWDHQRLLKISNHPLWYAK